MTGEVLRLAGKMPGVEAKATIRKIMREKMAIKESGEQLNQLVLSLSQIGMQHLSAANMLMSKTSDNEQMSKAVKILKTANFITQIRQ